MDVDYRLYALTSGNDRHTVRVAAEVAAAGAGVVQVRGKELSTRQLLALTLEIAQAVRAVNLRTRVIVNDRADVAWAARRVGAHVHGVHLGAEDLSPRDARDLLGPGALIGATAGTPEMLATVNALADVVSYVGCGPLRPTPTKDTGRVPLGLEGYVPLVRASRVPVVAIGGVVAGDVAGLAALGVRGVAMVSALNDGPDPAAAAAAVLRAWDDAQMLAGPLA